MVTLRQGNGAARAVIGPLTTSFPAIAYAFYVKKKIKGKTCQTFALKALTFFYSLVIGKKSGDELYSVIIDAECNDRNEQRRPTSSLSCVFVAHCLSRVQLSVARNHTIP